MTAAVLLLLAGFQFEFPGEKHVAFTITAEAADPFAASNTPKGKMTVRRGETFFVVIRGEPQDGWYTYPATKHGSKQPEGQVAKFTITGDHLVPLFPIRESEPEWKDTGVGWHLQHKKPFTWVQEVFVKPDAPPGKALTLTYALELQVCKGSCIQEPQTLTVEVPVSNEPPLAAPVDLGKRTAASPPEVVTHPSEVKKVEAKPAGDPPPPAAGGWLIDPMILFALLSGFVSLATPCVFPMIPITVSYFLKQGEAKKGSPVLMALVYSGTIALVLIAGGLALSAVLAAVINSPITNYVLAGLFLFFALSLLGWYDITLPSWLQDATASGENRGGLVGVFFMALTFSIISFACVGPIYGQFLAIEAKTTSGLVTKLAAVSAFSVAFASPFFVLALFPTWMRRMPRAGSWMNSVKVVIGFLELAAFVKFMRTAEIPLSGGGFFSYTLCVALYVALCFACALYLFGVYRLPHDHEVPETISVPRLMFALVFLGLGLYLMPALSARNVNDIPRKGALFAAIDTFLLGGSGPQEAPGGTGGGKEEQPWLSDIDEALSRAKDDKKLVFIDFTGELCTNCQLNEASIFTLPEVKAAFSKHVLLKLYADTMPIGRKQNPDIAGTKALRRELFKSEALPLYALLRPTHNGGYELVGRYGMLQGVITAAEVPAFLAFLDGK